MRLSDDAPRSVRGLTSAGPRPTAVPDPPSQRRSRDLRVRTTARRGYLVRRSWRRLRGLLGGLLLTCAAGLGWLNILLPFYVAMDLTGGDDDLTPDDRVVFDAVGRLLVLMLVGSTGAWLAGRYLLRVRRGTVLWLRKFQYPHATRVVGAALDHIGRTWRVVTLDDLSTPPVGVSLGLRLPARLLTLAGRAGPPTARVAVGVGGLMMRLSVTGLIALGVWSWSHGELRLLLDSLPGGGPRPDTLEADLVLVLLVLLVGPLAVMVGYAAVRLAMLPLLGLFMLLQGMHEQITETETAKLRTVRAAADVPAIASAVAHASQRALAPRLTVLRVDGAVWQQTVVELARWCSAVILDVSRPTDHLLWEIEQVTLAGSRIVFVAHADCLDSLVGTAPTEGTAPGHEGRTERLRTLLDRAEVLSYTTDVLGRVRFQRALFAELEGTLPRARLDRLAVRRALVASAGGAAFVVAVQRGLDELSPWL